MVAKICGLTCTLTGPFGMAGALCAGPLSTGATCAKPFGAAMPTSRKAVAKAASTRQRRCNRDDPEVIFEMNELLKWDAASTLA
jgi:hypothetical protein